MCCTVVVWLVETIWQRYPFNLIRNDWGRRAATFFGIIAIAVAVHFFLYFAQELMWGEAIRGTRRDAAPDWRWLHVGEMAIFFLIPALFLNFYCDNWPRKYSMPVNAAIRTAITLVAAVALYIVYYKTAHLFLGTQKGFSHPQQFPMIPMIWLVNLMLVHHWFMDNWPAWKLETKTAAEIAADHAAKAARLESERPTGRYGIGLGLGAAVGVALYFVVLQILPLAANAITIQ
jgi:AAT family amino acid transporter